MTRLYTTTATLSIAGCEQDTELRARVELERRGGMWFAVVDGPIQAHLTLAPATLPAWVDLDYLALDAGDRDHAEDCICECAIEELR